MTEVPAPLEGTPLITPSSTGIRSMTRLLKPVGLYMILKFQLISMIWV